VFHLVNVLSCPTHSVVYRQRQNVSCWVRSSQYVASPAAPRSTQPSILSARLWNSLPSHVTAAPYLSPPFALVFNSISSLSYPNLWLFLFFTRRLQCPRNDLWHFGRYNRYYTYIISQCGRCVVGVGHQLAAEWHATPASSLGLQPNWHTRVKPGSASARRVTPTSWIDF